MDWFADVRAFHDKFKCYSRDVPTMPPDWVVQLRRALHKEEYEELEEGLKSGHLISIADGIADLIYVLLGTAIACGIDIRPIWDEVQRSNMEKSIEGRREDGKIMKPEGWVGPRIQECLEKQGCRFIKLW